MATNIINSRKRTLPERGAGSKGAGGAVPGAAEGQRSGRSLPPRGPRRLSPSPPATCRRQARSVGAATGRPAPAHLRSRRLSVPGPPVRSASPGQPSARSPQPAARNPQRSPLPWRPGLPNSRGTRATAARMGPGRFASPSAAAEGAEEGRGGSRGLGCEGGIRVGTWPGEDTERGTVRPGGGLGPRVLLVPQFISL